MDKPAIMGGTPVRDSLLPYGSQWLDEEDIAAVVEVLRGGYITTGPKVGEFEAALAQYLGAPETVAVSSGTAALHTALAAAGVCAGDEVITTPLTFAASANAALYLGARPVFADIDPLSLNIDPADVAAKITAKTRAVVAVDFAGNPAPLDELLTLCRECDIVLIEDAAHAVGATYHGRKIGAVADLTTFSFHPVKHITSGEGGAVATVHPDHARTMRAFRNHGITSEARDRQARGQWAYEMVMLGYNYRLTDFQCALGMRQLGKLEAFLLRREEIADRYEAALGEIPAFETAPRTPGCRHAWHIYPLRVRPEILGMDRDAFFAAMRAENIGVNVHYMPVYHHPYYRDTLGYAPGLCPVAEDICARIVTLPLFPRMSDADIEDVVTAACKIAQAAQGG